MLIYIDLCALQRPHDEQSHVRVRIETAAVLGLLDFVQAHGAELCSSDTLVYEARKNPDLTRRAHAESILNGVSFHQPITASIQSRADTLATAGLRPLDALHLASAEAAQAEFLCSCDDLFLKRGRVLATLPLRVISPTDLITELGI